MFNLIFVIVGLLNLIIFAFSSGNFYDEAIFSLAARMVLLLNVIFVTATVIKNRVSRKFAINLGILLCMLVCSYMSYILNPNGGMFDFIITVLGYLAVPIYMLAIPDTEFNLKTKKWLQLMGIAYVVLFIYCGFVEPIYRNEFSTALSMGYSNPNRTGCYLLLAVIYLLVAFENNKKMKIVSYALSVILLYLIMLTECRTAFILGLIALIYAIIPKLKAGKIFALICTFSPLIFMFVYSYAYKNGWFYGAEIFGKDFFSGREEMHTDIMSNISMLGNYGDVKFGGLNVSMSVLSTIGVVGFLLFYVYYTRFMTDRFIQIESRNKNKNLGLVCMGLLMFHGCTETALFTGGTVYAGMVGCILALINMNNHERKVKGNL